MKFLIALLDANVLFPQNLRDVLLSVGHNGVYFPRWTNQIHDEWTSNLHRFRPQISLEQLERTRRLVDAQFDESLVENYQHLIPTLQLPDENDRHVLAAAIHCRAQFIVTLNVKDFPPKTLASHGIGAIAPDAFLSLLLETQPDSTLEALAKQRRRFQKPPLSPLQFFETLQRQGLNQFVRALRDYESEL